MVVGIPDRDANAIMSNHDFDRWAAACRDSEHFFGHVIHPLSGRIYQLVGRDSRMPKPAHVLTDNADIAAPLKESIVAVRRWRKRY